MTRRNTGAKSNQPQKQQERPASARPKQQAQQRPAMSQSRKLRQTYHVRLGLAVVLALETARRSFIRRGAKVGRECLGGHCVENGWDGGGGVKRAGDRDRIARLEDRMVQVSSGRKQEEKEMWPWDSI